MYELLRHQHRIYMLLLCIYFTCMPWPVGRNNNKNYRHTHSQTYTHTSGIYAHGPIQRDQHTIYEFIWYTIFVYNKFIYVCVCVCLRVFVGDRDRTAHPAYDRSYIYFIFCCCCFYVWYVVYVRVRRMREVTVPFVTGKMYISQCRRKLYAYKMGIERHTILTLSAMMTI